MFCVEKCQSVSNNLKINNIFLGKRSKASVVTWFNVHEKRQHVQKYKELHLTKNHKEARHAGISCVWCCFIGYWDNYFDRCYYMQKKEGTFTCKWRRITENDSSPLHLSLVQFTMHSFVY